MRADYHILPTAAGFRIALSRLPESECAAVGIHLPVGSRDDPPGQSGIAHFVEHMIFKGTATRDARQISIEAENAGAGLNAFTSEDQTTYEARGDASTFPLLAELLADMVWHSSFPAEEIELERDVIAEEILMYRENPSDHIGDLISQALWSPHPLGAPISGTLESIAQIDRPALTAFAERHHANRELVVSVAGPFSPDEVLATFEPLLPSTAGSPPRHAFESSASTRQDVIEQRATQQLQLAMAFPAFGYRDPRRHALRLLAMLLAEGSSSRLFQKLREEHGLCYQVACDANLFEDTGSLDIHLGMDPESREEALEHIRAELHDLATRGPASDELARVKRLAASHSRATMESTASHANWAGDCLLQHGQIITPDEALARLEAVTEPEIQAVANECFQQGRSVIAEIRPKESGA